MKQFVEALKAARKSEIILIIGAVIAIALCMSGSNIGSSGTATEEEKRMQRILSRIDGAGSVRVMLSMDEDGMHQGAVIVAPGAERIDVQLNLQQVVHTLTGLELERIEVVKSKR